MTAFNIKDVVGGLIYTAIGLAFFVGSLQMPIGTANQMGPGYFPLVLGFVAMLLGIFIVARGLMSPPSPDEPKRIPIAWRSLMAVVGGIGAFVLTIEWLGFVPAVFVAVLVSAIGDRTARPVVVLLMAGVIVALCYLIFIVALGLPIPTFRNFS